LLHRLLVFRRSRLSSCSLSSSCCVGVDGVLSSNEKGEPRHTVTHNNQKP
jgi:hypothetical protein